MANRLSDEHRKKISDALRGRTLSPEHRAAISERRTGTTASEETRAKLSKVHKGKPKSDAHRAAISKALQQYFIDHPPVKKTDYHSVHAYMGKASDHVCMSCGEQARDWAYQYTAEEELVSPEGWPYSLDPKDYLPMCRSCHKKLDYKQANATRKFEYPS